MFKAWLESNKIIMISWKFSYKENIVFVFNHKELFTWK